MSERTRLHFNSPFSSLLALALVTGCASAPPKPTKSESAAAHRLVEELRSEVARLRAANDALRGRNRALALSARGSDSAAGLPANAVGRMPAAPAAALPAGPPLPRVPLSVPPPELVDDGQATTEHFLYSKVLESFRSRNEAELRKSQALLLKSYPDSPFADNSLFLEGELALEAGRAPEAARLFDGLLARFPSGNKAAAALWGKASALKAMKKQALARETLRLLRARFPGSPEATRAEREMHGPDHSATATSAAG